ncbi:MAG: TM2 domain-containing protein [Muribaculaceae bacterium]
MDAQKVDMFIMMHSKELPPSKLPYIRQQLMMVDESKWGLISTIQFKDPTISLILSIFLGSFGIDRFYIGDIGLGIGKLLTGGGCGVWTIVDWFLIMDATREKNFQQLIMWAGGRPY